MPTSGPGPSPKAISRSPITSHQHSLSLFLASGKPQSVSTRGQVEREGGLWESGQQVVLVVRNLCGLRDCKPQKSPFPGRDKGCCRKAEKQNAEAWNRNLFLTKIKERK